MTGVGDAPRSLEDVLTEVRKRIVALERAVGQANVIDLSDYLTAGSGLEMDGLGTFDEPYTISIDSMEVADWDDATEPGFYWGSQALNGPTLANFVGHVFTIEGGSVVGRIVQELISPSQIVSTVSNTWRRVFDPVTLVWSSWVDVGGAGSGGGWTPVDASESVKGIAEVATQAETNAGTDDSRIVTPQKLASRLAGFTPTIPVASETVQGIVELATAAETATGTDATRAVHPAGLKPLLDGKAPTSHTHTSSQISDFATAVPAAVPAASETVQGKAEIATAAEVTTGTDDLRFVTPLKLAQRIAAIPPGTVADATETVKGVAEIATQAETTTGTDDARIVSPLKLQQKLAGYSPTGHTHVSTDITNFASAVFAATPQATESGQGKIELATQAEVTTGTDDQRAVTPLKLQQRLAAFVPPAPSAATETVAGIAEIATTAEVTTGTDDARIVTPLKLKGVTDGLAPLSHTHTASQITDFATAVPAAVPLASETVQGKVELATVAEATAGVDTVRAVTPAGVKAVGDTKAPLAHTHTASQITDFNAAALAAAPAEVQATETVAGKAEIATQAETTAGTDDLRIVTPLKLAQRIAAIPVYTPPIASETVQGIVELATAAETATGTDGTRAVHPAGVKFVLDQRLQNYVPFSHYVSTGSILVGMADADGVTLIPVGANGQVLTADSAVAQGGVKWAAPAAGPVQATETAAGIAEIATTAEVTTGTDDLRFVTPLKLQQRIAAIPPGSVADASETVKGAAELATVAEAAAGTDHTRIVTPLGLKGVADTKAPLSHTHTASQITDFNAAVIAAAPAEVQATETVAGKAELATTAEVSAGTDDLRIVTPLKLAQRIAAIVIPPADVQATETVAGIAEIATSAEMLARTDHSRIITPRTLEEKFARTTADCNTALTPGFYNAPSAANSPTSTAAGVLIVQVSGVYVRQEFQRAYQAAGVQDMRTWRRTSADSGATWSPWSWGAPIVQTGSFAIAAIASNSNITQAVTFPAGLFQRAPTVSMVATQSRLNLAFNGSGAVPTVDGFTAIIANWTAAGSSSGTVFWTAIMDPN
jgi:hypothetical protein